VRIALATCERLRELPAEESALAAALDRLGHPTEGAVWSDPGVRWGEYDRVILRSTWDYVGRLEEFLAWVDRVAGATTLVNPAPVVHWNARKTYLRDLEAAGLPVIPTLLGSEAGPVRDLLARPGWHEAVVKPVVSAASANTHRLSVSRPEAAEAIVHDLRARGEVLLQPYLRSVEHGGERSLVFLRGAYSHAVVRAPSLAPGSALEEGAPVLPTPAELSVAVRAARQGPAATLYARVDLVRDAAGAPRLMELEMIEPRLYLLSRPGLVDRWAEALADAGPDRGPFPTG
jgi:glutathione synthase/RimK-type ligase-like ATP-grasp enzyme